MKNKFTTILIIILAVFVVWFGIRFLIGGSEDTWICTDGGWKKHGEPSTPKPIKLCKSKNIKVISPESNELITSPLLIEGKARGTWFFEADAPIKLVDGNGNVLVVAYITAKERWMTEDFVEFEGGFEFKTPETETGTLFFIKANPSDLLEYNEEIAIPVRFDLK
ncbi:MAG: hypothetical protein HQ536_03590 [Parcubacteria group bacterium]|nr:hypothetical protein [Parcubacteria group bacterium]